MCFISGSAKCDRLYWSTLLVADNRIRSEWKEIYVGVKVAFRITGEDEKMLYNKQE